VGRRAARVDGNHAAIVAALEAVGCRVLSLASLGRGVPDLLVCSPRGVLLLFEVKDPNGTKRQRSLRASQLLWHSGWSHAPLHVVETGQDAVRLALAA
jgi:Holliday junction resolvase